MSEVTGLAGIPVSRARDGVDDEFALVVDRDLQADLGSGRDQFVDGVLDLVLEAVAHRSSLLCREASVTGRSEPPGSP